MSSLNEEFERICAAWLTPAVACWYRDQCRNLHAAFYLYFKPSGPGVPGVLVISEDCPSEDYQLADPRRISPAWSPREVAAWCREVARHLPIMAY